MVVSGEYAAKDEPVVSYQHCRRLEMNTGERRRPRLHVGAFHEGDAAQQFPCSLVEADACAMTQGRG